MSTNNEAYVDDYRANGFVWLKEFAPRDDVAALWPTCCTAPVSRCHAGNDQVTWSEAVLSDGHPGHAYFRQGHIRNLVESLARSEVASGIHCWMSLYQEGEYITPHRDRCGLLQVLICLKAPHDPSSGGLLVLADKAVYLRPGDALVFAATEVEHYTTPLRHTATDPVPVRAVLAGRFFARSPDVEQAPPRPR